MLLSMNIKVKDGTPNFTAPALCESCQWACIAQGVRQNEVLVSRIIGWYSRGIRYENRKWSSYVGPITIVSIDSGVEYDIAESMESFTRRMGEIVDASPIFEISAPANNPEMAQVDNEIAMAENLYDVIRSSGDKAGCIKMILSRFEEAQKEHCKNSHFGECLS